MRHVEVTSATRSMRAPRVPGILLLIGWGGGRVQLTDSARRMTTGSTRVARQTGRSAAAMPTSPTTDGLRRARLAEKADDARRAGGGQSLYGWTPRLTGLP